MIPCEHVGTDCVEWFHDQLDEIHTMAKPYLERVVPMERITKEEREELYRSPDREEFHNKLTDTR